MHQPLVEQPTWAYDQEHRNETAKDDHAIAGKPARRLQEADVDHDAEQRPKRSAEAADHAGKAGRNQLHTDNWDTLRGGEQIVLPDHAKGDAKPRAFEKKKSKQRRAEQSVDDQHELCRTHVILKDISDTAETLDAVRSDRFAVPHDLIAE